MQLYYSSRGIVQICSAQLTHQLVKTSKFMGMINVTHLYIKLFKFFLSTAQQHENKMNLWIKWMSEKGLFPAAKFIGSQTQRDIAFAILIIMVFMILSWKYKVDPQIDTIEPTLEFKNHVLTNAQLRLKKKKKRKTKKSTKTGKNEKKKSRGSGVPTGPDILAMRGKGVHPRLAAFSHRYYTAE